MRENKKRKVSLRNIFSISRMIVTNPLPFAVDLRVGSRLAGRISAASSASFDIEAGSLIRAEVNGSSITEPARVSDVLRGITLCAVSYDARGSRGIDPGTISVSADVTGVWLRNVLRLPIAIRHNGRAAIVIPAFDGTTALGGSASEVFFTNLRRGLRLGDVFDVSVVIGPLPDPIAGSEELEEAELDEIRVAPVLSFSLTDTFARTISIGSIAAAIAQSRRTDVATYRFDAVEHDDVHSLLKYTGAGRAVWQPSPRNDLNLYRTRPAHVNRYANQTPVDPPPMSNQLSARVDAVSRGGVGLVGSSASC